VIAAAVAAITVLGAGVAWWSQASPPPVTGGTPRLVVDRTDIDLGNQPFETPVRATFTLTNTGDGMLQIAQSPPVKAVLGC
jgi:hypothetical protein